MQVFILELEHLRVVNYFGHCGMNLNMRIYDHYAKCKWAHYRYSPSTIKYEGRFDPSNTREFQVIYRHIQTMKSIMVYDIKTSLTILTWVGFNVELRLLEIYGIPRCIQFIEYSLILLNKVIGAITITR